MINLSSRICRAIVAGLTALVVATGVTSGVSSASASGSYIYNPGGSGAGAYCVNNTGCAWPSQTLLSNGQQVTMHCWFDDYSRFFEVYAVPRQGRWLVDSAYVRNQTSVPHC